MPAGIRRHIVGKTLRSVCYSVVTLIRFSGRSVIKSWPLNSTHYAMLYPQNGDRIVTIDSVASLRPMYTGFRTWLTMTAFVGCTLTKIITASSLRKLVSTKYSSGSEFQTSSEPTMITRLSNPILFHASAVRGSRNVKLRDSVFATDVVENTAYFRLGSILPSTVGVLITSCERCTSLLVSEICSR